MDTVDNLSYTAHFQGPSLWKLDTGIRLVPKTLYMGTTPLDRRVLYTRHARGRKSRQEPFGPSSLLAGHSAGQHTPGEVPASIRYLDVRCADTHLFDIEHPLELDKARHLLDAHIQVNFPEIPGAGP